MAGALAAVIVTHQTVPIEGLTLFALSWAAIVRVLLGRIARDVVKQGRGAPRSERVTAES